MSFSINHLPRSSAFVNACHNLPGKYGRTVLCFMVLFIKSLFCRFLLLSIRWWNILSRSFVLPLTQRCRAYRSAGKPYFHTALHWHTFFLQANLRETGQISKGTIPGASVVATHVGCSFDHNCDRNFAFLRKIL